MFSIVIAALVASAAAKGYCWKSTYGRGVGIVPSKCPSTSEKNGALCYDLCKPGYVGNGPVCWEQCPSGWQNDGATCRRASPLKITGKKSYGRGWGSTLTCGGGDLEADAGLCYHKCKPGYKGVGPVCHQICGAPYPSDCSDGCTINKAQCAILVTGSVALAAPVATAALATGPITIAAGATGGAVLIGLLASRPKCPNFLEIATMDTDNTASWDEDVIQDSTEVENYNGVSGNTPVTNTIGNGETYNEGRVLAGKGETYKLPTRVVNSGDQYGATRSTATSATINIDDTQYAATPTGNYLSAAQNIAPMYALVSVAIMALY